MDCRGNSRKTGGFRTRLLLCTARVKSVAAGGLVIACPLRSPMPIAASRPAAEHELIELGREATAALDALLADAIRKVGERVVVEGHPVGRLFDREQRATHGLAWLCLLYTSDAAD